MIEKRTRHIHLFGLILILALLACTCGDLEGLTEIGESTAVTDLVATEAPEPTSAATPTLAAGNNDPATDGNIEGAMPSDDLATALNWDLPAVYADINLDPNFDPNPYFFEEIWAGGQINVLGMGLGEECLGNVTTPPTVRVNWSGASFDELDIWFTPELEGDDTTLIVRAPDGLWWCSDDDTGIDPKVEIEDAPAGVYNIWVGYWDPEFVVQGTLYFEEDLD